MYQNAKFFSCSISDPQDLGGCKGFSGEKAYHRQVITSFVSCWIESDGIARCGHRHTTVNAAENCIQNSGGFIRALDDGVERVLNEREIEVLNKHLRRTLIKAKAS